MKKNLLVEITSTAFKGENGKANLEACQEKAASLGFDFGVQLHNTASREEIEQLRRSGVALSAHAPLNCAFNWNLAAESVEKTFKSVEENVCLFREAGIRRSVFHGFFMTDKMVPAFGHGRSYDDCMNEIRRDELLRPGCRLNADFFETPEFQMRQERVRERIAEIAKRYSDICFCLETDFPAYGAGNVLPESLTALNCPICLDTGHLWCSCFLFQRDFYEAVDCLLESGRVEMLHFHASRWNDSIPVEKWGDGHLPLGYQPCAMDLSRVAGNSVKAGVRHIVLEIVQGSPADLLKLAEFLSR